MARALGIDIGNGYCYATIYDSRNGGITRLMNGQLMNMGMPSTVFCDRDGKIFFNQQATTRIMAEPGGAVYAVKSRLGSTITLSDSQGTYTVDPLTVYKAIVEETIKHAQTALGLAALDPEYNVVVSYPADYCNNEELIGRIKDAIESITINGHNVTVIGMVPEPAAAALDFLYYQNQKYSEYEELTAVVYDLGHGSFDTALVRVTKNPDGGAPYDVLYKSALPTIGGYLFDNELIEYINREILFPNGKAAVVPYQLRTAAVKMKHTLSADDTASEMISIYENYGTPNQNMSNEILEMKRQELEGVIEPYLNDTYDLISEVFSFAEKNNIAPDFIVISGGSGNIPKIKNDLESMFLTKLNPNRPKEANAVILYEPHAAVSSGNSRYALGIDWPPLRRPNNRPDQHPSASAEIKGELAGILRNAMSASSGGVQNEVMSDRTIHKYGVLMASDKDPYGVPEWLIEESAKLPAVSETFKITPVYDTLRVTVTRPDSSIHKDSIYNLIDLNFEGLNPGRPSEFCLGISNELEIYVICRISENNEKVIIKSSMDRFNRQ